MSPYNKILKDDFNDIKLSNHREMSVMACYRCTTELLDLASS